MKLGRRWLYVLWIACTVLWHQAGVASSPPSPLTGNSQWAMADEDSAPPVADFALSCTADLEDQDLIKRVDSSTTFIEHGAAIDTPCLVAAGSIQNDLPQGISATTHAWRLIRGPPVRA